MKRYSVERADSAGTWHLVARYATSGEAWDRALGLRATSAHGLRILHGDELLAWCDHGILRETSQGREDARDTSAAFPVALCPRCTDEAACDDHEARP